VPRLFDHRIACGVSDDSQSLLKQTGGSRSLLPAGFLPYERRRIRLGGQGKSDKQSVSQSLSRLTLHASRFTLQYRRPFQTTPRPLITCAAEVNIMPTIKAIPNGLVKA
jgi:hypothetical protein